MPSYTRSIALYEETRQHLAGGVSRNVRYGSVPVPLFFARGEGARLYDEDGNVHIDYILGNGPAFLGHAPARAFVPPWRKRWRWARSSPASMCASWNSPVA